MTSGLEDRTLYVGIDESNHGRDNEIHAAVFSYNPKDILNGFFPKPRSSVMRRREFGEIKRKSLDFSFIIIPRAIREKFQESGLKGPIVASLLQNIDPKNFQNLNIYLDGDWAQTQIERAKKYSAEVLDIQPERLYLRAGRKSDITIRIVHYAQCVASYLYKNRSIQDLDKDEHQRQIYLPEIYNLIYRTRKPKKPIEQIHQIRPNRPTKKSFSQY